MRYGEAFLGTVGTESSNPWVVTLQVMNEAVDFYTDTGAEMSMIPDKAHKKLGSPSLTPANQTLKGPSNEVLPVKGRFSVKLVLGNHKTE